MKVNVKAGLKMCTQCAFMGGPNPWVFSKGFEIELTPEIFDQLMMPRSRPRGLVIGSWKGREQFCSLFEYSLPTNTLGVVGVMISGTQEYVGHLIAQGWQPDNEVLKTYPSFPVTPESEAAWQKSTCRK